MLEDLKKLALEAIKIKKRIIADTEKLQEIKNQVVEKSKNRNSSYTIRTEDGSIRIIKYKFTKKPNESVFIPQGAIHRIENPYKKPVKIIEVQTGPILKESDIVRYQDIYGRVR